MSAAASLARAELIGVDALRALRPGAGEIAAVFHRSIYIRSGAAWACIGTPDIGAGPLNILVDLRCDWSTLVSPGEAVRATGDCLQIGRVPVSLARAKVWHPPPVPCWTARSVADGLALLDELVRLYPPPAEGLGCFTCPAAAPVSLEARAAAAPVASLIRWLGGAAEIPDIAPLLGLGPGLTPSGDDYLAGALTALHATRQMERRNRLWSLIAPARSGMTGAISAAHLECAAEGRLAAQQHMILHAILASDRAELGSSLAALAGESHTSPWDGLAGMASALRAVFVPGGRAAEWESCKKPVQLHTTR